MVTQFMQWQTKQKNIWSLLTTVYELQGSKLKKVLKVAFWQPTGDQNIVTKYKFLVASLYNVNDAAHSIRDSDI